jgi:NitT/TauT family transport system substrate-binding protein
MTRKSTIYFAVILIIVVITSSVGTYYLTRPPPQVPLKKAIIALPFVPNGRHSVYYVALDKGFYEDVGISATILRGYGSADTIKRVETGQVTFGEADIGTLILLRGQGVKVKNVGMMLHENPLCIYTLEDRNILEPEQLEGLTLGSSAGNAAGVMFPLFANVTGIDVKKVNLVNIASTAYGSMLISRQIDGFLSLYTVLDKYRSMAQSEGLDVDIMRYYDFGIEMYGNGLIATDDLINNDPDFVRGFVIATFRGIQWAIDNPKEAINIQKKYLPEIEEVLGLAQLNRQTELMKPALELGREGKAIGMMDYEIIQLTITYVETYMGLERVVLPVEVYTNQFVEV